MGEMRTEAAQAGAAEGIRTYVIGMGEADPDALHTIAAAGDTEQAYILDIGDPAVTEAQLAAALGDVRSAQASCSIQIPPAPDGQAFDRLQVNVEFVSGTGAVQPLFYAGSLGIQLGGTQITCPDPAPVVPANPWFWTYDDEDAPTQIRLCPSACDQIESDPSGGVNVAYGCTTRVAEAP